MSTSKPLPVATAFDLVIADDSQERFLQSPWQRPLAHKFTFAYECPCGVTHIDKGEAVLHYGTTVVNVTCSVGITTALQIRIEDPIQNSVEQTMQDLRGVQHTDF